MTSEFNKTTESPSNSIVLSAILIGCAESEKHEKDAIVFWYRVQKKYSNLEVKAPTVEFNSQILSIPESATGRHSRGLKFLMADLGSFSHDPRVVTSRKVTLKSFKTDGKP